MPPSAATSRATSITPASRTATRRSIGDTIWIIAARNIRRAKSSPTTIPPTARRRSSAGAAGMQDQIVNAGPMNIFYLHGFASSARSSKAAYFAGRFRERGRGAPRARPQPAGFLDADGDADGRAGRTALIEDAVRAGRADRVEPGRIRRGAGGAEMSGPRRPPRAAGSGPRFWWKQDEQPRRRRDRRMEAHGKLDIFHYAYGRMMPVHYELYADARRHDASTRRWRCRFRCSRGGETRRRSRRRGAVGGPRPNVELHMLDDDHQLTASVGSSGRR